MQALSYEDRCDLARRIVALLDDWGVRAADQVRLLGLPPDTRPRAMKRYREATPLPADARIMERVEHLAGIADALRTANPRNAKAGAFWMNRANHRFDNRTPLATMIEDGLDGVIAVRAHLDCAFDWDLSGSQC